MARKTNRDEVVVAVAERLHTGLSRCATALVRQCSLVGRETDADGQTIVAFRAPSNWQAEYLSAAHDDTHADRTHADRMAAALEELYPALAPVVVVVLGPQQRWDPPSQHPEGNDEAAKGAAVVGGTPPTDTA